MSFYHRRESHDAFEPCVYDELQRCGFLVRDLTYHNNLDEESITLLKNIRTPTALLVRTRADRLIIHRTAPVVLKVEVKTSGLSDGGFAIEAFPLAGHVIEAKYMNAQCLYICYQTQTQHEFGFWVSQIVPHITRVFVPPTWYKFARENQQWLYNAFPRVNLSFRERETLGSNTPYVIIPEEAVKAFPDWRTHISDVLKPHGVDWVAIDNDEEQKSLFLGV
jgi:hypothetical protein